MEFAKSIENEALRELPLRAYEGSIYLVNDQEDLEDALPDIRSERVIGFDTETRPSFKKGKVHPVSLLQIATTKRVYLIRLGYTGLTQSLVDIFENPRIKKVGLAIHDDLHSMKQLHYFRPNSFIDIQEEVRKLGFENFSLKKITAIVLGFRISKSQQLSNWDAPKLTPAQMTYAATDAWVSLEIYKKLMENGVFSAPGKN